MAPEDELLGCLRRASRLNPDSPSNKQLRALVSTPRILDYLERLVTADRHRPHPTHRLDIARPS